MLVKFFLVDFDEIDAYKNAKCMGCYYEELPETLIGMLEVMMMSMTDEPQMKVGDDFYELDSYVLDVPTCAGDNDPAIIVYVC